MFEREQVKVFDTTLRDGEQSPGCSMNREEKLRMAHQLEGLGVDVIEAGFPIASDGEFRAVQAVARDVRRPVIAALARARHDDIQCAWQAIDGSARPRIHTFLATSDIHLHHKLHLSRRQCLEQARDAVRLAASLCSDVEFSPEDATRTDPEFLCEVLEAVIEAGATTLNIPDTVGYTTPVEFAELIAIVRRQVRGIERATISVHCHNDLGLAVANSLAAIGAGAKQVECTINGIGERAGNAALEEIVMAVRVRPDRYPFDTAIAGDQIFATSQMLAEITGVPVQPNKAIIGRNAFAHEAGIHQDGVVKNPLTYEIMMPQSVGVPHNHLVLGKHSGRHALGLRFEALGFQFERSELDAIYKKFVVLADQIKTVENHHLLELIREAPQRPAGSRNDSAEPAPASKQGGAERNGHRPMPAFPLPPSSFGDSSARAAEPQLMSDQEEQEDYYWGV
jgi:2-isopropylmalate synthase